MNNWENENKIKIIINFHLLTENQRMPNMLGQVATFIQHVGPNFVQHVGPTFLRWAKCWWFCIANQRWPNANCSLMPNVGPTSTCYLGRMKHGYIKGKILTRPSGAVHITGIRHRWIMRSSNAEIGWDRKEEWTYISKVIHKEHWPIYTCIECTYFIGKEMCRRQKENPYIILLCWKRTIHIKYTL